MERKTVEAMRKAFGVSVAAFEAAYAISKIFNRGLTPRTLMHKLHIMTLTELNEDEPSAELIDKYLRLIEGLTELHHHEQKHKKIEVTIKTQEK